MLHRCLNARYSYFTSLIALIVTSALVLSGCASVSPPKTYFGEKLRLVEPDPRYLADCEFTPPPERRTWRALNTESREDLLTRTLLSQYAQMGQCNKDKASLREIIATERAIVNTHNAKEEARIKAQAED